LVCETLVLARVLGAILSCLGTSRQGVNSGRDIWEIVVKGFEPWIVQFQAVNDNYLL
jgi:hypothetical protein